jgi:CheY-like chemotaxis protein
MKDRSLLIYLADDDEDDRLLFSEALSCINAPVSLISAEDGNKLMQILNGQPQLPDIIFLDLNMPHKNGKETLRELRAQSTYSTIPVIIYSTSTSILDIDESFESGADMYLEKPYTIDHLVKMLDRIIASDWENKLGREEFFVHSRKHDTML